MPENWLIFVDTNILLDFYRLRGASALKQLSILEANKGRLILTEQVEMEFLKHRQRVVAETLNEIKKPTEQKFPPFLDQDQPSQMIKKSIKEAVAQHRKVQDKIERIIANPAQNDKVYQSLLRVFKHRGPYALSRETNHRFLIRSRARKRFSLGYPPRKKDDNSIGDALNWEWVVHCAQSCSEKSNVILVSRDGDYGIQRSNGYVLNDWLKKEFQDRVSKKRKVELTDLLTRAFKKIEVPVTREEEKEEKEIASEPRNYRIDIPVMTYRLRGSGDVAESRAAARKVIREIMAANPNVFSSSDKMSDILPQEHQKAEPDDQNE